MNPSVDRQFIQAKVIFVANRLVINPENLENYGRLDGLRIYAQI